MKKTIFALLVVLAAAAVTTSCNKEVVEGDGILIVRLPTAPSTRGQVEAPNSGQAPAFVAGDNLVAFLMNGNSVVYSEAFTLVAQDITNGYLTFEQVAPTINRVLVVARIPSAQLTAVEGLSNYSSIRDFAYALANQNATAGLASKTIWGETSTLTIQTPNPIDPDNIYKECTVELSAITARFEIGSVFADPGKGLESIEVVGVWMNNYYADNSVVFATTPLTYNAMTNVVWNTTPATTTSPSDTPFGAITLAPYSHAAMHLAGTTSVNVPVAPATVPNNAYVFHVFAGENCGVNEIPHIVMLVKGELSTGYYENDEKYVLGWLTFRTYREGSQDLLRIQPNHIYKVGLGGIPVKAEDITTLPETERFDLRVFIQIVDWTIHNIIPELP
ncbi:MAG: hypothetical protein FWE30_06240 [Bacteroidales bacterium]|nr:hypothetical protein [Bacteroidales bacterium]